MDIDLYLTEDEFWDLVLSELRIENGKLGRDYKSLDCALQRPGGKVSGRKVVVQYADFEEHGDGVRVEYNGSTYHVKFNERASSAIDSMGQVTTRYGNGEKLGIYIEGRI